MTQIFVDSDVILDLLLNRAPFNDAIADLLEITDVLDINICVSCTTITNIHYIVGKIENASQANLKTGKILELVHVEPVGDTSVRKAFTSAFKDFEDAVQNYCAIEAGHQMIVTRNIKDYKYSSLAVLTPPEALTRLQMEI